MSWSRRGILAGGLAGALVLAACGFSPVYGPGGTGGKLFGQIRAADPSTPDEYTFAGRIAEQRASNKEVQAFAEQMVKDHSKMLTQLQQFAPAKAAGERAGERTAERTADQPATDRAPTERRAAPGGKPLPPGR